MAAGGMGVIGLGVGAVFLGTAISEWRTANDECRAGCPAGSTGLQERIDANIAGSVSAVALLGGGVLLAGGVVLWFTAPSGARVQVAPSAGAGGGGLTVRGTF